MTEAEIEHKLVEFCRRNGLLTYKFTSPSSRGVPVTSNDDPIRHPAG